MRHHLPVVSTLGRTALWAALQPAKRAILPGRTAPSIEEAPLVRREIRPLPASLLYDYLRWCGADPRDHEGFVPPHLFPQWSLPVLGDAIAHLPYPLLKVINAGCRMEVLAPIPAGKPLIVEGRLAAVDEDGRRALLRQRCTTSTGSGRTLLVAEVDAFVPLAQGRRSPKEPPRAYQRGRLLGRSALRKEEGLRYALLAGDFNPVHWLGPYARAAGFPSVILHGFATMALTYEWLAKDRRRDGGEPPRELAVRFTRPLVLPREIGFYRRGERIRVADAPGQPAYLTGTFR